MAKTMVNAPAQGSIRVAGVYESDWAGLVAAHAGDGVLSGLAVTPQASPNMTVAVAGGLVRVGGWFAYVAAQSVTIGAASALLDRWDLVVADRNGVVSVVAGVAADMANTPSIPADSVCLARVFVVRGATAIRNDGLQFPGQQMVFDDRLLVPDFFDIPADFLGSSLSNTAATSAGSIGECAWTMSGTTAAPAFQTSAAGRPGILRAATGTTSGNRVSFHYGNAATSAVIAPADVRRMRFNVAIPTITTMALKFGLGQDLSVATVDQLGTAGAWVEYVPASSLKWRYVTRQASVSTANVDTGADVVAGNWYQFDLVRKQNGNWQFAENEVLQFEHSTNLPTTVGNIGISAHTLTAAARNFDIDFHGLNFVPSAQRWT